MKTSLITLVLACSLLCGCAAPRVSDEARLQGLWLAHSESLNGHTKSVDFRYVFRGDRVTFTDETGRAMTYVFTLDAGSTPKLMTIVPDEPGATKASVAYALNGDSLTIVVAPPGATPTEISDKHDQELIVCRRKRP